LVDHYFGYNVLIDNIYSGLTDRFTWILTQQLIMWLKTSK